MFTQTPTSTKARFTALKFRANPHAISEARQSRAAALAPTVKAIKPGVYVINNHHFIDLWRNLCTCREHRVHKVKPCIHRLALWLAEGVDLDDPNPVKYLQGSGVEQPKIIAWYCQFSHVPGIHRVTFTNQPDPQNPGENLLECIPLGTGVSIVCSYKDIYYLTPFYE